MNIGNDVVLDKSLLVKGTTNLESGASSGGDINVSGAVNSSSPMTAPDFIKTSDYRIKKNVTPIETALNLILKMKPCLYEKDFGSESLTFLESGLIAHELQEIISHPVQGEKDGAIPQSISYIQLIPYLIRAIQEQQKQIEELRAGIIKCSKHHIRFK